MDDQDGPADLAAVQADSQLLDEIGRGQRPTGLTAPDPANEALVEALMGWRQVIDAEPVPELVGVDTAQAAIRAGSRRGRRRFRQWVRDFLRRRWR